MTGQHFPQGTPPPDDDDGLEFMIGAQGGKVVMRFPKPVIWFGMPPNQAMELAEILVKHARKCGATRSLSIVP